MDDIHPSDAVKRDQLTKGLVRVVAADGSVWWVPPDKAAETAASSPVKSKPIS